MFGTLFGLMENGQEVIIPAFEQWDFEKGCPKPGYYKSLGELERVLAGWNTEITTTQWAKELLGRYGYPLFRVNVNKPNPYYPELMPPLSPDETLAFKRAIDGYEGEHWLQ